MSIQPVETEFGRKRAIDQTACNKDLTCVSGFCPAIVTVSGAKPRKAAPASMDGLSALPPRPVPAPLSAKPFSIIVAGVGGSGVVTIGAILGMAAHLEGKGCGIMDMAGLAQKGGNVVSYVKLAERPQDIAALRVGAAEADLVLGCDLVAAGARKVLGTMRKDETALVVNTATLYPGEITRNPDYDLPSARLKKALGEAAGKPARFVDATRAATTLLGNALGANMFMLGFAWQQGLVPLAEGSIEQAIALNGEAIEMNRAAFAWGRRAAAFPDEVEALVTAARPGRQAPATSLDTIIARREAELRAYQNAALAERYRTLVDRARSAEKTYAPGSTKLTDAVARSFFKLLAIKDEYEVARLYADGRFARQLAETFDGDVKLTYHLAPPVLGRVLGRKRKDGKAQKRKFGSWVAKLFPVLAAARRLRGTPFDVFGYSAERRADRQFASEYETLVSGLCLALTPENHASAVALAALPDKIRGYGHVKDAARLTAKREEAALLAQWREEAPVLRLAAE